MYNQNYCKDQKHVHELTGSTKIFNECGDCHNHRFCTVTGEAIYHNEHDHFFFRFSRLLLACVYSS